ncbi:hypothetical protein Ptr902_10602 [Pyrenophora tritici-repentis]|uniref:Uncharacterized protein n=1 Tax=Pyrenophora tritici-repentis TaxID=45151 RepID=A0A834RMZ9_9PLEO|nr:hypothetical protein PtrM4_136090 [Pyrenophora tritici-repentis]KAI2477919.1 hypothetical protein Ptr902_10602 [Pyrenophora tritici-repentis]PZC88049.1 hypothetical protein A1F95_11093 [Pyrenophora tritici-repentis]
MTTEEPNSALQLILEQIAGLTDTLAKQEARYYKEMAAMRKDFEERLNIVTQLARTLLKATFAKTKEEPAPEDTLKSERLPNPPAFSGKKKDLLLFLTKLRYKLKGNADRFPTKESQLIYAHSRLEHDLATLIDPLIGKDIVTQGKRNFLSYFAKFRRLVADTNLNEGA